MQRDTVKRIQKWGAKKYPHFEKLSPHSLIVALLNEVEEMKLGARERWIIKKNLEQ